MERVILHADMDAFYASIEQLDDPLLRGRPVVVGGNSERGVVSAASYEAREYGIRSAMPVFQAKQRCPHGVFLPVRMGRYRLVSEEIMRILEEFTPLIERISIDEAYMDISGTERAMGPPEMLGLKVKGRVRHATGLTCSVGIAPNKFLAKIASDMRKPDGLTIIRPGDVSRVVDHLPIERVPGVGEKVLEVLRGLRITTLGSIRQLPEPVLFEKVGRFGMRLQAFSRGMDDSAVVPQVEAKSVSSENTLSRDTKDRKLLERELLVQCETVGRRLRKQGLKGRTITLKLKCSDFRQITRGVTLDRPTSSTQLIYGQGRLLLKGVDLTPKFRLIGIGVSNLLPIRQSRPRQLTLFADGSPVERTWEELEAAMDLIKERFGADAIKRGLLYPEE